MQPDTQHAPYDLVDVIPQSEQQLSAPANYDLIPATAEDVTSQQKAKIAADVARLAVEAAHAEQPQPAYDALNKYGSLN